MKLNICMLLFLHYEPNMRVVPQIGICAHLRHFGHDIDWIIWGDKGEHVQPFYLKGIRVYTTPEVRYFPGTSTAAVILNLIPNTLKRMSISYKILKKGNYDLILVRDFAFDGVVAAYIRRRYKTPFVFLLSNPLEQVWEEYREEHTTDNRVTRFLYFLVAKFHQFLVTRFLRKADLILPTSKWLAEHLAGQGIPESKIMPCPSGVDVTSFCDKKGRNVRDQYHLDDSRTIIYVGEMTKSRHLDILLRAFSRVRKKSVKLLMVGEGRDKANLRQLANELNIQDDVIFTGQVPQDEVPDFIAAANIGVSPVPPLPFFKLSSPIKLLEYMAMGKPVVANDEIPEQKEILEESGAGILVSFTSEAFADALAKLLDNTQLAAEMGQKARDWVVKNRSYEILARQVEQSYLTIVNKNRIGIRE